MTKFLLGLFIGITLCLSTWLCFFAFCPHGKELLTQKVVIPDIYILPPSPSYTTPGPIPQVE